MDHGGPDQQLAHHKSPPRPRAHKWFAIQLHQPLPSRTGSIIHGDLFARCNPSLDNPFRHTPFSLLPSGTPATFYSSKFHFAPPKATFRQGAAPAASQPASYSSPCVGSTHLLKSGSGAALTPFFLRQSCSGPSWRSLRQACRTHQASEVIMLLTQPLALPSSLYFAGPPNQNRAGVKFSQRAHLGSRFIFFWATGPVWTRGGSMGVL